MSGRFTIGRWARIIGGTAAVMTWATAVVARGAAADISVEDPADELVDLEPEVAVTEPSAAAVPDMPANGLVVIRVAPAPTAPAVSADGASGNLAAPTRVIRRVEVAPAPAAPKAVKAPAKKKTKSSGS